MNFERGTLQGINVHVLPTNRFKTYSITLYMGTPLQEDTVTETALIPYVLRRGTANIPETVELRKQLDHMYGAGFGFNITKRGNTQFVQFRMDVINDSFVSSDQSLLAEALKYLGDVVTNPLVEDGHFRDSYVEAEKQTLKKQLDSVINDKIRYAAERCIEEMCENEPYRLNAAGRLQDIAGITSSSLYDRYRNWLKNAQIDLYVAGDTSLNEVSELVSQAFMLTDRNPLPYAETDVSHGVNTVKTIVDQLDVNQGKLNLGLRANVDYASPKYAAAIVYNGILGAFPHSKLFVNVREKASLAYYCSSRLDAYKGILTIQSGIEIGNYEKALQIIEKQLDAMKAGQISDKELDQTKAMLSNSYREILDSASEMIAFDFGAKFAKVNLTPQEMLERMQNVSIQDVQEIAQQVELDTIYFLRDRQEV